MLSILLFYGAYVWNVLEMCLSSVSVPCKICLRLSCTGDSRLLGWVGEGVGKGRGSPLVGFSHNGTNSRQNITRKSPHSLFTEFHQQLNVYGYEIIISSVVGLYLEQCRFESWGCYLLCKLGPTEPSVSSFVNKDSISCSIYHIRL